MSASPSGAAAKIAPAARLQVLALFAWRVMTVRSAVDEAATPAQAPRPKYGASVWVRPAGQAILAAAAVAGLVARVWLLAHHAGALDSDEAVVGLMARHILHGEFPTFYWGQQYGGSLEAFLTAGLFAVVGPSTLALKAIPFALDAAATLLVWRVGRRMIGEATARMAAALFWVWPASFVWSSVKAQGFYGVALVDSLLIVLLVLRLADDAGPISDWIWLGLSLGIGWWSTPEIAFVALPAMLWLAFKTRPRIVQIVGLLAGGASAQLPGWYGTSTTISPP